MSWSLPSRIALVPLLLAAVVLAGAGRLPDQISSVDRNRAKQMSKQIFDEIRKNYFDPTFGGRDVEAIAATVAERIDKAASLGQALGLIAQSLIEFNDSHLYFIPPARATKVSYDWRLQMIGDACFIVAVRPGGDAARQDVAPGDRVLAIDGFPPTRSQLWKQLYNYRLLNPRTAVTLKLERQGPAARDVTVQSSVSQGRRSIDLAEEFDVLIREYENAAAATRHQKVKVGDVLIWKMVDFDFDIDDTLKWALNDARDVVFDLRGNPGGDADALSAVVGRLFDRPVTIADLKGRKPIKPLVSRKSGRVVSGRVVAIVDSESGSAAELLARVLQIEKRGTVLGDRSSGSVRRSYHFHGKIGGDSVVLFGASITDADVSMTDGRGLEHAGVVPDEIILPTAADLAADRDPALSRAVALLGLTLDPAQAGKLFPREWK